MIGRACAFFTIHNVGLDASHTTMFDIHSNRSDTERPMFVQLRFLVAALVITGSPFSPSLEAQSVASNLAALQSDDAHTRVTGLNRLDDLSRKQGWPLCSPQASSQVKQGLIAGLDKENHFVRTGAPGSMDEEEADEYYPSLIGCVAGLHDRAALHSLLGAIVTGGGATTGLVALGDAAVPGLLAVSDSGVLQRFSALLTLADLASGAGGKSISTANRAAIRARALAALDDPDGYVRSAGITALMSYSDAAVRRAITARAEPTTPNGKMGAGQLEEMKQARSWLKQDKLRSLKPPQ
jgi:hypothetical protein